MQIIEANLFPAAAAQPTVAMDGIPLPPRRAILATPDVTIEEVCDTLAAAAQAHELPAVFFIRLIWQESRFDPRAISPVGAQGVAQFMPDTAAAMGLKNPFDPQEALPFSARLLRELLGQFGNLGLAAAAYNAGPKRILDWLAKRGKLPKETRDYVQSITGHAAERWRVTRLGRLNVDVPKRAPCQSVANIAYLVQVPAPAPVAGRRAPAHLLAERKAGDHKPIAAARKKAPVEVSATRKRDKARSAARSKPLIARASAARKRAKQRRTRTAARR